MAFLQLFLNSHNHVKCLCYYREITMTFMFCPLGENIFSFCALREITLFKKTVKSTSILLPEEEHRFIRSKNKSQTQSIEVRQMKICSIKGRDMKSFLRHYAKLPANNLQTTLEEKQNFLRNAMMRKLRIHSISKIKNLM